MEETINQAFRYFNEGSWCPSIPAWNNHTEVSQANVISGRFLKWSQTLKVNKRWYKAPQRIKGNRSAGSTAPSKGPSMVYFDPLGTPSCGGQHNAAHSDLIVAFQYITGATACGSLASGDVVGNCWPRLRWLTDFERSATFPASRELTLVPVYKWVIGALKQ